MAKLEEIIKNLTIEEKISLTYGSGYWTGPRVKGFRNTIITDGPHGVRLQNHDLDKFYITDSYPSMSYPSLSTLANSFDDKLIFSVARQIGLEASKLNVDLLLAPGLNIKRDIRCGRNFEYFSEDPLVNGRLGYSFIKGVQKSGVGATIKHASLNNQETLRFLSNSIVDKRTFRELYFYPFEYALRAKPYALMTSYNKINGIYASENSLLLKDLIRKELKYKGLIISDWGARNDPVLSLKNGLNLEMPAVDKTRNKYILDKFKKGKITEKEIDEAIKPVIKFLLKEKKETSFNLSKAKKVALKAAQNSIVMLKNDNILPLNKNDDILVLGYLAKSIRYQGLGSSEVNPICLVNPLDSFNAHKLNYTYLETINNNLEYVSLDETLEKAKDSKNIVIFVGLPEASESEGFDKETIDLPNIYLDLIDKVSKINKNIVVVVSAGSQTNINYDSKIKGLLYTYLSGSMSGEAIYNILYGKSNPTGRLAETFVANLSDTYLKDKYPINTIDNKYSEGLFVGYPYYYFKNINVKYPFGYGLSYNKVSYSNFKFIDNKIFITLTNDSIKGYDTLFLFVESKGRYIRLKDYKKISLNKNEIKEVSFEIKKEFFDFFSISKNKFVQASGEFKIHIATNLNNIIFSTVINNIGEEEYKEPLIDFKFETIKEDKKTFSLSSTLADFENTKSYDLLKSLVNSDIDISQIKDEMTRHERLVAYNSTPLRFYTIYTDLSLSLACLSKIIDKENKNSEKNEKKLSKMIKK